MAVGKSKNRGGGFETRPLLRKRHFHPNLPKLVMTVRKLHAKLRLHKFPRAIYGIFVHEYATRVGGHAEERLRVSSPHSGAHAIRGQQFAPHFSYQLVRRGGQIGPTQFTRFSTVTSPESPSRS